MIFAWLRLKNMALSFCLKQVTSASFSLTEKKLKVQTRPTSPSSKKNCVSFTPSLMLYNPLAVCEWFIEVQGNLAKGEDLIILVGKVSHCSAVIFQPNLNSNRPHLIQPKAWFFSMCKFVCGWKKRLGTVTHYFKALTQENKTLGLLNYAVCPIVSLSIKQGPLEVRRITANWGISSRVGHGSFTIFF